MELLRRLVAHTTSPEFVYEHRWRPGDCIVWDNRNTLHAPSAFDVNTTPHDRERFCLAALRFHIGAVLQDTSQERLMWRITIEGDASEQIRPSPAELEGLLQRRTVGEGGGKL